jgi:hypothetical protein
VPEIKFDNHKQLRKAFDDVRASTEEQTRLERAIGRAVLDRVTGKNTELPEAYKSVGGHDPAVIHVLNDMNKEFVKIKFNTVKDVAATAANREAVAASKNASIREGNPVFTVEHTALNTLAKLGGEGFARKFQIDI